MFRFDHLFLQFLIGQWVLGVLGRICPFGGSIALEEVLGLASKALGV